MASVYSIGFSDDELHKIAKMPKIKSILSEMAKERYPKQRHLALNCLQAGFSIAIDVLQEYKKSAQQANVADAQPLGGVGSEEIEANSAPGRG